MFLAKSSVPCDPPQFLRCTAFEQLAQSPFTFFEAPAGYLLTENLSALLTQQEYLITWLRLGVEDCDPATFLLSLIHASRGWNKQYGTDTLKQMQRYPGAIYGWPARFECLAREFSDLFSSPHAIVLENIHHLDANQPVLNLAQTHFLNLLPASSLRILISETEFPVALAPHETRIVRVDDLRIKEEHDPQGDAATQWHQFPNDLKRRLVLLTQGRSEVLLGVLAACDRFGCQYIQKMVKQAKTLDQLLSLLVRNDLKVVDPHQCLALALTLYLGYFHAELFAEITGNATRLEVSGIQNLSEGWQHIRQVYRPALENALRRQFSTQSSLLCRAADLLIGMGAIEIAIPLYFRLQEYQRAAKMLQAHIEEMMNYGQWEILHHWLKQLPREVIEQSPQILYVLGELETISDSTENAKHNFRRASEILISQGNSREACRSLLAESALAFGRGDEQAALLSAQNAQILSKDISMRQERSWANWQLGMLATMAGKPGFAKTWFKDACQLANSQLTKELCQQVLTYTEQLEKADLQQEFHQREAQLAGRASLEAFRRLVDIFRVPSETLADLLKLYGWLAVPLMLKLPTSRSVSSDLPRSPLEDLLRRLKAKIRPPWRKTSSLTTVLSPSDLLPAIDSSGLENQQQEDQISSSPSLGGPDFPLVEESKISEPQVMVYCLGSLRVLHNKKFITEWPSKKVQLVFKYLLLHRHTLAPKEAIMEIFWAEADIESARRNLHQAIYNLRQTLKSINQNLHFIEFEQDGYRINPQINIWIDYEVFEQHYKTAQQLENMGSTERAIAEYTLAEQMYMDNLFSEDLYEDWLRAQREYLWQIYLSTATRLAEYHFQKEDYPLAISIAQRILQKDRCEETAHQILIQCFHSQGQRQLAIRQYEICRQALKEELDVEPSGKTRQLFATLLED